MQIMYMKQPDDILCIYPAVMVYMQMLISLKAHR